MDVTISDDITVVKTDSDSNCSFFKLPQRKRLFFVLMAFSNFLISTCFSILAPFFPAKASEKGMSQSVIGLVFSCFEFVIFITSPVYGTYMRCIGPRFACISGQFVAGSCAILFGLLYLSPDGVPYIALCFSVRIVQALGSAAFITASFTLIANEFSDYVSTAFSTLEIFSGLGYCLGPLLGGLLCEIGGFGLPFFVMGSLLTLSSLACLVLMPTVQDTGPLTQKSSLHLLASPLAAVGVMSVIFGCYTFGFMDSCLSVHLEQFSLSTAKIGCIFSIVAILYSVTCPFYGRLCDKYLGVVCPLIVAGCLVTSLSLLMIGPSPVVAFLPSTLWFTCTSLVVLGVAIGAVVLPPITCLYMAAQNMGFQKGLELNGLVSGLVISAVHCGAFLGPTVSSPVMEAVGFGWSATLNAGLLLLVALCTVIYLVLNHIASPTGTTHIAVGNGDIIGYADELTPILSSDGV